jgi:hypothetical protein
MIEKGKISEWIDRYNTRDLPEDEYHQFSQLVLKHPVLQAEVRLDRELNTIIEDEDTLEILKKLRNIREASRRPRSGLTYFLLAASFLALVATSVFVFLFIQKSGSSLTLIASSEIFPSDHMSVPGKLIAYFDLGKSSKCLTPVSRHMIMSSVRLTTMYQPLPEFEFLVGASTRAAQIRLLSPLPRLNLPSGSTIFFQWSCSPDQSNISIEILNNAGKVLSVFYPLNRENYLLETSSYGKGLIYWKIIMDEELMTIGSIVLM